jgi:hypothetical protein
MVKFLMLAHGGDAPSNGIIKTINALDQSIHHGK